MAKFGYSLLIVSTTNDPFSQLQQPLTLENVLKITNWHQKNIGTIPMVEMGILKGKLFAVLLFLLWKKATFAQSKILNKKINSVKVVGFFSNTAYNGRISKHLCDYSITDLPLVDF